MAGCGFVGTSLIFHPVVLPGTLRISNWRARWTGLQPLYRHAALASKREYEGQTGLDRARRCSSSYAADAVRRDRAFAPWPAHLGRRSAVRTLDPVAARSVGQRGTRVTDGSVPLPAGAVQDSIAVFVGHLHPGRATTEGIGCSLLAALVPRFGGRRPVQAEATSPCQASPPRREDRAARLAWFRPRFKMVPTTCLVPAHWSSAHKAPSHQYCVMGLCVVPMGLGRVQLPTSRLSGGPKLLFFNRLR